MQSVLTEIINLLVGGISGIASSIGQGLQSLVTAIFLTGEGTQASPYALSVYGAIIIVFLWCGSPVLDFLASLSIGYQAYRISRNRGVKKTPLYLGYKHFGKCGKKTDLIITSSILVYSTIVVIV